MCHHQGVYKVSVITILHFTKSATIPVLTPSGPEWSCFLQRQVMCKGQFTVNQRYDFNPLPIQHFRWHNSTFFSLRAAVFKIDASHLEMTTCPRHRDSFGSRWQSGRPIYTIPDEITSAPHKSSSVKGLCGLRSNHSAYVLYVYFYILAVCSNRFT